MATYEIKLGESDPIAVQPVDDDGLLQMPDAMQMRIDTGSTCIAVDGVEMVDAFDFDLNALTLDPRLYCASIYGDWGQGWIYSGAISLMVKGGC